MYQEFTIEKSGISTENPDQWQDVEYPLMEDFYTIQGEGIHSGKPAYFIRTAGCDVNCFWCDVPESWEESDHRKVPAGEIVQNAANSKAEIAVITGGEPLLHNLDSLTYGLKKAGMRVHIETSGSSPLSGYLDWVTFSPKKFKQPREDIYNYADELKIIVRKNKDFEWAEYNAELVPDNTCLLLQPEWYNREEAIPLIVEYVHDHPKWRVSLQSHKYMKVP
jgi:organic radical activating enzyme